MPNRPAAARLLASAVAGVVLLAGCATQIAGQGSVAADAPIVTDTVPSEPTTPSLTIEPPSPSSVTEPTPAETTSESSETASSEPDTSSESSEEPSLSIPTDLPDLPTDLPDFPSFGELPADWPAELALPEGSEVGFASTEAGTTSALFSIAGTADDVLQHFDAQLTAAGYTATEKTSFSPIASASYEKDGTKVELAFIEFEGEVSGTITITG
jgi:cytoskeletal protein RodZ